MLVPSEALGRQFDLADETIVEQPQQEADNFRAVTTHAVLVGNIGLLLPSDQISELMEDLPVCRLPNTAVWFRGVTSVRGNMIPVFDLHRLFGFNADQNERKMIVVGAGDTAVGFYIDQMPQMVMVTSEHSMNRDLPLPQLIKDHAQNFFLKDGQVWIEWDEQSFFTALGRQL